MDDQFGGRTDDDLFFDDFEPVVSEAQPTTDAPPQDDAPNGIAALEAVANGHAPAKKPEEAKPPRPSRSLLDSRHNTDRPPRANRQAPSTATTSQPSSTTAAAATTTTPATPAAGEATVADPASATAATAASAAPSTAPSKDRPSNQASVNSESRIGSGANPRTKLTDSELADKMAKMRLLSAEKARKFEQAEKDERDHAHAYAKGMEDARKRRAADAERRRQGEEDRRRMEDERAKNRERKLKAMSTKEGGWDEGKEALAEEEARRGFRGANGGIRGTRSAGGLAGSRFARADEGEGDAAEGDRFGDGGYRGRGRGGRGAGGRGRGGRGGERNGFFDRRGGEQAQNGPDAPRQQHQQRKPNLQGDEFPALPASATKPDAVPPTGPPKVTIPTRLASEIVAGSPPLSPPVGDWGDEMNALDAKLAQQNT